MSSTYCKLTYGPKTCPRQASSKRPLSSGASPIGSATSTFAGGTSSLSSSCQRSATPLMEYLNQLHQHICYLTRVRAPGTRSTSTSSDFLAPILQRSKIMDPSIAPSPLNRSVIPSNQRFRQIHRVCRYPSCGIGVHLL